MWANKWNELARDWQSYERCARKHQNKALSLYIEAEVFIDSFETISDAELEEYIEMLVQADRRARFAALHWKMAKTLKEI
jgi:hypothetical protein